MGRTRAVVREAEAAAHQVAAGRVRAVGIAQFARRAPRRLGETTGFVRRVLAQTRARALRVNTWYPAKLLSLSSRTRRRSARARPSNRRSSVAGQDPRSGGPVHHRLRGLRLACRIKRCGCPRRSGTRSCSAAPRAGRRRWRLASAANVRAAADHGVRRAVLPRQRREGRSRAVRAALKWRTGCEGRISALKRRHGLRRCRYKGLLGMERWVGLGVIANACWSWAERMLGLGDDN